MSIIVLDLNIRMIRAMFCVYNSSRFFIAATSICYHEAFRNDTVPSN